MKSLLEMYNAVEIYIRNNFNFYAYTRLKLGIGASETYKKLFVAH